FACKSRNANTNRRFGPASSSCRSPSQTSSDPRIRNSISATVPLPAAAEQAHFQADRQETDPRKPHRAFSCLLCNHGYDRRRKGMSVRRRSVFAPLAVVGLLICSAVFASGAMAVSKPADTLAGSSIVLAPGQRLEIAVPVDQTTPGIADLGTSARNAGGLPIASHPQIKGFAVQQTDVATAPCFDPAANAAAATSITADPNVAGVVGHLCSSGLAGALPVYESAEMVVLSGSATD